MFAELYISVQSGVNSRLFMAQGFFTVVKSERKKVGSADLMSATEINFVRKTGHFINEQFRDNV